MKNSYTIPNKVPEYLRRLVQEYSDGDLAHIGEVIAGSTFSVEEETSYDNWDGGQHGHDLTLYIPDHLMRKIPLDDQSDIQARLVEDLNKAASSAHHEYISDVHFEYPDGNEHKPSVISNRENVSEAHEHLWHPETIRVFISHRDTAKKYAHQLATELKAYGIDSFVAHDTIEPDEDWLEQIELALQSMDAMLVFITDNFFESAWTNQEIGYALARGIPIVSIKVEGKDPAGFIRNRQAINGTLDNAASNAAQANKTLKKRLSPLPRYRKLALRRFMNANSYDEAASAFEDVKLLQM